MCPAALWAQSGSDNFNDNVRDQTKWGADVVSGNAALQEINQRLEFTVPSAGLDEHLASRPWLQSVPVNADWEAVVSVFNTSNPSAGDIVVGMQIINTSLDEVLFIELYAFNGGPTERGFLTSLDGASTVFGEEDTGPLGVTAGAVKMSYNAAQKVVTTSFDRDGSGTAFGWQALGSFGLAGSGGSTANRNWSLPPNGDFMLAIGGFAGSSTVTAGTAWLDDFAITVAQSTLPPLTILREGNSVRISWPAGLGLVQPQKRTNLISGAWQDLGAATTAASILETVTPGQAYYRIRSSVTNPPVRPAGIYMGNFAGQADNGGFGVMLRSNGLAYVVGYNTPQDEGVFASGFPVAADGTFATLTAQGGNVDGTFTAAAISGSFRNSTAQTGSYSGNRKSDSGTHTANVGYYAGTYSGAFSGNAYAVAAADGSVFFFTTGATGDGGGFGTINAANTFSGTTVPDNIQVSGTFNPSTKVLSGSYSVGGNPLGTFSLTRTLTP